MFYNYLFPQYCREKVVSLLILALRVFFGVLFFTHGLDKMINFNTLSETYPSVLGFGSYMTLMVSIFCEFACSLRCRDIAASPLPGSGLGGIQPLCRAERPGHNNSEGRFYGRLHH